MHPGNHWGGSLEVSNGNADDDQDRQGMSEDWDRASLYHQQQQQQFNDINDPVHHHHHHNLNDTQKSWLLGPTDDKKKKKYVDLGCVVCSRKLLKWSVWTLVIAFMVIALPIILVNTLPKHKSRPPPPDNYTLALHKALLFFNAQKSGKLPKSNGIPWRGNSGLEDGNDTTLNKNGLVGGYYDAGDNAKFHFPMAYTMTMLSWSVIEYSHKYESIGEYKHVRELIKWGTDYLLLTFNSSSTKISQIYCQVGGGQNGSTTPDDHSCWQRPEDMDYERPTQTCVSGPDLAGEMAAALAAASIVFKDNAKYSKKLVQGAETLYSFARDSGKRRSYSRDNTFISPYYNSTGYYDEYMWGAAWLYYATGNSTYISLATNPGFPKNAKAFYGILELSVPSWNNKLPAAMLLLTRLRIFLNPGYPAEDMLRMYHNTTCLNMCSYLQRFQSFNWTRGGMILLNKEGVQPLQYAANSAFLANLFADYLTASGGLYTRQKPYENELRGGFWHQIPRHVHHRGASIPNNKKFYSCKDGWKWFHSSKPNPNNITGAMVGGPDRFDRFRDVRSSYNYTEPTLAGNAGLVAALVSLTTTAGDGIDKNTIFSEIPPPGPQNPPPPPPWKP
ncbi:hypothetical protein FNV43_RR03643 [Rhamnella rubrinervis]|uniref:Endoglucanase n=1 Tax=Rhamnella rubrinervis TaxID=2594499 RepID=A0A8K0HJ86_9ROSA|nr:hypothetical protein FNV43_RR03643 [Rhamnella rubrinervis]